ncbi:hypothetical protein Hanom_Chr11g01026471 [Helianthus anomalus]
MGDYLSLGWAMGWSYGELGLFRVLGINTNMGVIRKAWFGRNSFRWSLYLHPTPKPNPLGIRSCVLVYNKWFLFAVKGMGLLGWVGYHRWNMPGRILLKSSVVWIIRMITVMLRSLGPVSILNRRKSKRWLHLLRNLGSYCDKFTHSYSRNSFLFFVKPVTSIQLPAQFPFGVLWVISRLLVCCSSDVFGSWISI